MKKKISTSKDQIKLHLGTWMSLGLPIITELASEFSFNWLLFDLEHGCLQESDLIPNLQAVRRKDTQIIVRVGSLDPSLIARVLDWGASGIMMPHVSEPGKAIACINSMRYPPDGNRGYSGSVRAYSYGIKRPEDLKKIPKPQLFVQIEDYEGVQNADDIARVKGVDVLFIGPSDLKHDLFIRLGENKNAYREALQNVLIAARRHGKLAGILIQNIDEVEEYNKMGFSRVAVSSDIAILRNGYNNIMLKYNLLKKNDS